MFNVYNFHIENNCKKWKGIQIEFFLREEPFNNKMPLNYLGLCEHFMYQLHPWLFCAFVDGFNFGKIKIPHIETIEDFHERVIDCVKVDYRSKKVSFEFDLSDSSITLLNTLFKMLNYKYYTFIEKTTTFKNRFGLSAERVVKIDKVIINDLEVIL